MFISHAHKDTYSHSSVVYDKYGTLNNYKDGSRDRETPLGFRIHFSRYLTFHFNVSLFVSANPIQLFELIHIFPFPQKVIITYQFPELIYTNHASTLFIPLFKGNMIILNKLLSPNQNLFTMTIFLLYLNCKNDFLQTVLYK